VELRSEIVSSIGISRPSLPKGLHFAQNCTDGWFICAFNGAPSGNGKNRGDGAGPYIQGGRVGVLLDLDGGSLGFFKNGVQHDPGYGTSSVTGPVVAAVQMVSTGNTVRPLPNARMTQQ
jgi:hypothetical protein